MVYRNNKGQAALEFLMTYGWAFLVMIAVIAGIIALDPLGAAQTNVQTCQMDQPLTCDGDAMLLDADGGTGSNGNLTFRIDNAGTDTITVTELSILPQASTASAAECVSASSNETISPGTSVDLSCTNVSNAITGAELIQGDQYVFDLVGSRYNTRVGSAYTQRFEGQIRITAS